MLIHELIYIIINVLIFSFFIFKIFLNNVFSQSNDFFFQSVFKKIEIINGFTMLVPSHIERINILKKFLSFTLKTPPKFLHEIIINWARGKKEIEELINDFNNQASSLNISIRYFIFEDSTVNSRFLYPSGIKSEVFLSIDDDILMKSSFIDYGYQIWKNHPNQIVGYTQRSIKEINNRLIYAFQNPPRIILTNIAFLSPKLIDLYYDEKNKENLEFVKKLNNCEDILMNYVVTKEYNLSAVFINRNFVHLGSSGISTKKGHYEKRTLCLNEFYKSFGIYPQIIKKEDIFK